MGLSPCLCGVSGLITSPSAHVTCGPVCMLVGGGAVAELSLALGEEMGALVGGGSSSPRTLKDVSQQWVGAPG